jgi:hypothetical protein
LKTTPRLGIIFGASSAALRSIENPRTLLDSESTWEHDVAAELQPKLGAELSANVCVYREADIQELSGRLEPLATVLTLIRSHPQVAVEETSGTLISGPAAIETIIAGARPVGVSAETWQLLARAAGIGLAREAGAVSR